MKSKSIFITFFVLMLLSDRLSGQGSNHGNRINLGIRVGETSGLDFRYNINNSSGLELLAGVWNYRFNLTGLYEKYAEAFETDGLKWYYGAGGHFAFRNNIFYYEGKYYDGGDVYGIGIDGIVGLEYNIPDIPFLISIDIKPFTEISSNGIGYFSLDPGLGLRFIF